MGRVVEHLDVLRQPPWSPEAEQSVLGALLLSPDALDRLGDLRMNAAHFFDRRNRLVWEAIVDMAGRHLPIDVITVYERLRQAWKDDAEGGIAYLNALSQSVPSAAHIRRYAEIVIDKAMRRELIEAADKAAQLAYEPGEADAMLDQAAALIGAIKRQRGGGQPRQLSELARARVDHWTALERGEVLPGIPTGLSSLDEALGGGFKPGTLVVLGARPSIGKTSLAGQLSVTVAEQGHAVLMLSQEMRAGELTDRFFANLGGVPLDRLTAGALTAEDWSRVPDAVDRVSKLPLFIDDQPALTLSDIRAKARQVQQRHGLALVVVDYLQLCASIGGFDRRHHQIEQISRGMKTLAKELGATVLLLSQLNRGREEPELDNLKESGAIEEDADTVLLLHPMGRETDGSMLLLVKIPKNRQGRRGRLGMSFDGKTQRWKQSVSDITRRRGAAE
jgi:replicative DNA helicase